MKILVDARSLGKKPSGIGMSLYNFMIALKHIEGVDLYAVTDVAESAEMERLLDAGVFVCKMDQEMRKGASLLSYYRFLQRQIHEVKPDIFWEGNNLFPTRLENPYGKIVVTIYDMFPLTEKGCYGRVYPHYFRYGIKNTLKYADALLYISEETKRETERFFPEAKERRNFISYVIMEKLPEFPITDDGFFLYIGNLEKRKGTDILIKAYFKYREAGGEKPLVLGGKIREPEIEKLLDDALRRTNGIKYLGYTEQDIRNRYYASCSAFLFPSRAEGFGMPVVEILQYQKPVITSDLPIFEEITDGLTQSFPLDPDPEKNAEALAKTMLHASLTPLPAERTEPVIRRYQPEALAKKTAAFFAGLLHTHR